MSTTKFDVISSNDGVLWGAGPLASHGDTWSSIILSVVTPLLSLHSSPRKNMKKWRENSTWSLYQCIVIVSGQGTGEGFYYLAPVVCSLAWTGAVEQ